MTARVNILQLITELRPGGAEWVVGELAKGLDADRYRSQVCSLRPPDPVFRAQLEGCGIELFSLDIKSKLDVLAPRRLAALLRSKEIDILHSHLFHANFLGSLALHFLPPRQRPLYIRSVHAAEEHLRPWRYWLEAWTLGKRDSIVCVSEAVKSSFGRRSRISDDRFLVIPNGVDLELHREKQRTRAELRSELRDRLRIPASSLIACAVGRLEARKGQEDLLHAWRELQKDQGTPQARLLIAGQGREEKRLTRLAHDSGLLGSVTILGQVEDVPSLLAAVDLFVMPSRSEGFCLALVEAMAAALPILATDLAISRELLGPDGAALLVPPSDVGELCSGLRRLIRLSDKERTAMGAAARERSGLFGLPAMLERYQELYSQLLTARM